MEFIESLPDDDEVEDEPVLSQADERSESHDFEELEGAEDSEDDDSESESGNDGVFYLSDRDIDEEDAAPAAESAAPPHGGLKSVKDDEAKRVADEDADEDADIEAAIDSIALASAELRSVQPKIQSLGSKLRRVQSQLVERQAQIEALEGSERRANETIRKLEAELAHRQDLFESLQGLVGQLQQTLTTADPADKNDR
jgi:chromosome segregation ATPase